MTQPASVPADGNLKILWVPSLANPAVPTVTELTAGSVVDLSCYITGDGWVPNTDEATIDDERLCTRQTLEQPGRYKDGLDLVYVYNPLSPADNEAQLTLVYLTVGHIVARFGDDFDTAITADDIVDVYTVKMGRQKKLPIAANQVLKIGQKAFVTANLVQDVTVAA